MVLSCPRHRISLSKSSKVKQTSPHLTGWRQDYLQILVLGLHDRILPRRQAFVAVQVDGAPLAVMHHVIFAGKDALSRGEKCWFHPEGGQLVRELVWGWR